MKKRKFVLLLALALCLVGCEKAPGEETLPSVTETVPTTAVPTTVPPETTVPPTTLPPETTEPEVLLFPQGEVQPVLLYFGMTNAFDSEFELDYQNYHIMALEAVEVKGIPSDSVATNRVLNYELVHVHAAVYRDDGKWVLVSYDTFDGGDNIGWVKVSGLTEYTDDNKEKLLFPVNVSDGCKDMDTGETVEKDEWRITSFEGGYVTITRVGGRSNKVKPENIVYPDTTKAME